MTDVFISYKREERDAARRLAETLQKHGFSVWWDAELLPGEQYRAVTLEILESCRAAIVIWSAKSARSSWVLDEAQRALDRGVLVPVQIEKIGAIPLGFGQIHAHDLTAWDGSADHPSVGPVIVAVQRLAGVRAEEAVPSSSQQDVETEVAFWRGVRDSREAEDFEAYLKRYPQGLFAELARNRAEASRAVVAKRRSRKTPSRGGASHATTAPRTSGPRQSLAGAAPASGKTLTPHELLFVAVVTVLSAFVAWPLANSALGLPRLFFSEDYALLFSLETPQNVFIMTPLLLGAAWGYDRGKTLWAARGRSALTVQYGVLAVLIIFFLVSLGMRDHAGRETHLAIWLIFVWAAATFARQAVVRARQLVRSQSGRRG